MATSTTIHFNQKWKFARSILEFHCFGHLEVHEGYIGYNLPMCHLWIKVAP